jgi:hypothetical protein
MKKQLLFVLFGFFHFWVAAQPTKLHGCHFHHKQATRSPWTPEKEAALAASNSRSDTFDIVKYRIFVDISDYASGKLAANTEVFFSPKMAGISTINLDLLGLTVDSIKNGAGMPLAFTHTGINLSIDLGTAAPLGDTNSVRVWYRGKPIQSTSNFGGVYFESSYIYNLSIGLTDDPHNFGHAWFPCFDNFVERSSYELSFLTTLPYRAYAVGIFQGETLVGTTKVERSFKMDIPVATYQVSFAAANWGVVTRTHEGVLGIDHTLQLLAKAPDTNKLKTAFLPHLGNALDALESWFGPYSWDRVGYAMATRGAMENPGNTIYPDFLIQPANFGSHLTVMAHELAHNWWGNVVTVGSEYDMWVKEGNAEYGAYLYYQYAFGQKDFEEIVKEGVVTVLKSAHYDDGGFLPLSPMPHEQTYGTHTYYKGAMMMHNLRAYLGDSLFATGMRHLQQALRYDAMDAYEMRDTLSTFTGVDLTNFFEDWIFSPGFSDFAIDEVQISPNTTTSGHYDATVKVRQGIRAAPHLHHNVPIEVNFRSTTGQQFAGRMIVPDATGEATFEVPFEPALTYLNGTQTLNTACVSFEKTIKLVSSTSAVNTGANLNVKALPAGDSAFTRVERHWTAPEADPALPSTVRLSNTHYWKIEGIWPAGFVTGGLLRYDKSVQNAELDKELIGASEDSLILVWRPHGNAPWQEHPAYAQLVLGSAVDGAGYMRVDTFYLGEYALAKGTFGLSVGTQHPEFEPIVSVEALPNPVQNEVLVIAQNVPGSNCRANLFDLRGELIRSAELPVFEGRASLEWSLGDMPAGTYLLHLEGPNGPLGTAVKVVKN